MGFARAHSAKCYRDPLGDPVMNASVYLRKPIVSRPDQPVMHICDGLSIEALIVGGSRMSIGEYTFSFPIWVEFGIGVRERIGPLSETQGWSNALIVTDPGIISAGLLEDIRDSLVAAHTRFDVHDDVEPNPTVTMVENAATKL